MSTVNGHKYFLTIIDDCTRSTQVYLMKSKSEIRPILQSFYLMIKNQFAKSIKVFRTNNGLDFQMVDFFKLNGSIHQHSCIATPKQNSIVERKHQYILCVARALKLQSNILITYQGDCILTAVHLTNKLTYPLLNNKSPFELLYNKAPYYSYLRVFGYLCFSSTLSHNRGKFDPRATKCAFLGYYYAIKGYELLNLQTKSYFISRDVVFHESVFPFQSLPSFTPLSQDDLFSQICILDAPPLPIIDSIHHSTHIPDPLAPIDNQFLEDRFIDLLDDLSVFNPNDITDTTSLNFESIPDNSVFESTPVMAANSLPISTLAMPADPLPRRSTRLSKPPAYLQAYKCNAVSTKYPIANYVSNLKLSFTYSHFCNSIFALKESVYYH